MNRQTLITPAIALAALIAGVFLAPTIHSALNRQGSAPPTATGEVGSSAADDPVEPLATQLYQSGMHPWIITTEPGNCPICGMKLEPIDPAKLTGEIAIDPAVVQNIGVRTARVIEGPAVATLRTVGTVEVAEPNVHDVNLRITGWIEDIAIDYVGAPVTAGQPLLTVYSPQLYAAEEEFLLTLQNKDASDPLVAPARDRLLNLGLTPEQVDELAARGEAWRNVPLLAPADGVVLTKHANPGMNVEPGMRVFRIADLSTVWVQVPVYESQLAGVAPGQTATMTVDALGGETFTGEVAFVDPVVDPMTRAARVRIAFANPDNRLKPGLFANVILEQTLADNAVLAPREAVNHTGERSLVFVALGQGRFEPREVRTGANVAGGQVVIDAGLTAGEKVVTSGQFLLDSEASVRASLARMVGGGEVPFPVTAMSRETECAAAPEMAAATASANESSPPPSKAPPAAQTQPAADAARDTLFNAYLDLQQGLIQNDLTDARPQLEKLRTAAAAVDAEDVVAAAHIHTDDLAAFREGFKTLSDAVITLAETSPPSGDDGDVLRVTHCPMVNANWLQLSDAIENPYDPSMLRCGVFRGEIETK